MAFNGTYSVSEDATNLIVTVARRGAADGVATVNYQTLNGTALAGVNFRDTHGALRWERDELGTKTITIPILNTRMTDPRKAFSLFGTLQAESTAQLLLPASAQITILRTNLTVPAQLSLKGASGGAQSGTIGFNIAGPVGQMYEVQSTTNFVQWLPIASILNQTGATNFSDPISVTSPLRFYRVFVH